MPADPNTPAPPVATEGPGVAAPAPAEPEAAREPARTGPEVIQDYLKRLPSSPGVYRMIDAEGTVIYVGKARSLKARVSNYARLGGHTNRIARMIASTAAMEFVTVRTEAEALLLEANLIKRFRPRFNVLMRDDKSFPYILITRPRAATGGQPKREENSAATSGQPKREENSAAAGGQPKREKKSAEQVPQIVKHRGARNRKGDYFGPFASAGAVNRTINMLERAFLLRSCSDSVFESRTRPCLLYQIKRCSGPCTGEIAPDEYGKLVDEAVRFLRGESQNVRQMYQRLMEEAAAKLEFEQAAKYRNRLWALAHVTSDQSINPEGIEEADVFAAHQDGGQTCIQVFFFRTGQNWGNRAYFPKADRSLSVEEVLDSFIAQFYDDKQVPRLILLSHDVPSRELLAEALSTKADRRIEVSVPQRGGKAEIMGHAVRNAREALARRLAESSTQRTLLEQTAERFGLPRVPRRVEVFDNSHIMGTNAVGAMIVAGPDGFVKACYRKFNIKSPETEPGDDYAMMREVLTRRFKRLASPSSREQGEDGAEGQLEPTRAEQRGATGTDQPAGSRIEPPAPPPITERGSAALAFGVLRADTDPVDETETETDEDTEDDAALDLSELPDRPDLVLIDGGAGQLKIAREVMTELGITDIALVGVAKGPDRDAGREHFHVAGRDVFMLEARDPVLYFIQRLRDEAHRFAIGTHRAKRAKAMGVNPLDEIPGIGPTRKRALLQHFGSAKSVSRANLSDLEAVKGISAEMARKIYDFFHDRKE